MTLLAQKKPPLTAEEDMHQYMQDIRQFPRLDPQQERALARRCAEGDQEAVRQMVSANLRLVVSVAREYAGRGVPLMDLIQEGSIGLLAAARKFDYTRECRFSTYATKWIRQGVTRCLMNHTELIRVPGYTYELISKVGKARAALLAQTGREPTAAEIARLCGLPEQKVEKLVHLQPQTVSLDAPIGEESSIAVVLEDLQAPQPQEALVRQQLQDTLERLLSQLTQRQQQVLRLHFGMDGQACSLEQIGQRLQISKERVRQIEKQAMQKLKTLGADMGLEDFLA